MSCHDANAGATTPASAPQRELAVVIRQAALLHVYVGGVHEPWVDAHQKHCLVTGLGRGDARQRGGERPSPRAPAPTANNRRRPKVRSKVLR